MTALLFTRVEGTRNTVVSIQGTPFSIDIMETGEFIVLSDASYLKGTPLFKGQDVDPEHALIQALNLINVHLDNQKKFASAAIAEAWARLTRDE